MKKLYASLFAAFGLFSVTLAADVTKKGEITKSETWTSDNTYQLDGYVIVTDGATLTIEAGTVVKGINKPTTSDLTSALIIARGSKIEAVGTAEKPIIFTSEFDDVNDPDDIDLTKDDESRGLWGGLILLGKAPIGNSASEATIEGLPEADNTKYGGTVEDDNSGTLKYVSIRHGGSELAPDEEINGLSLGGVGNKTVIEYIEITYNSDDGIEFFGGSVNVKWATVSFCGDDCFDWDLGWRGKGQFWFGYGGTDVGDHGGEFDGAVPDDNARYVNSTIYNFTFIGGWNGKKTEAKNEHGIVMRDGTAGTLANGIIYGYNNYALEVEDRGDDYDAFNKMKKGELKLLNNIWYQFGSGSTWDDVLLATPDKCTDCSLVELKKELSDNNNELAHPGIDRVSPVPNEWSLAATKKGVAEPSGDSWFSNVDYIGAFAPGTVSTSWISWSALPTYAANATDGKKFTGIEENSIEVGIYPNPTSGNTNINFNIIEGSKVAVQILDLNGKVVATVANKYFNEGLNNVTYNTNALMAGVYFIKFTSNNASATQKLIVE